MNSRFDYDIISPFFYKSTDYPGPSHKSLSSLQRRNVDMIVGSMEFSLGSVGGFACGSTFVIRHQRLAGAGYVFSASLPPLHASMVIKSMDYFEKGESWF
jgi:serine palmitoyltransferase